MQWTAIAFSIGWLLLSHAFVVEKSQPFRLFPTPTRGLSTHLFSQSSSDSANDELLVSDAEALLACWTYLRRTKKLGNWTQLERRKLMKASAQPHFFWEDSDVLTTGDEEDEIEEESGLRMRPDPNNHVEVWSGEFTSFPTEPSQTRVRRSQAAKRTWQDPEFRKKWHEQRWGKRKSQLEDQSPEEKLLVARLRELPAGFLRSPELAGMTVDDISKAIEAYSKSRKQRGAARKKTLSDRKAFLAEQVSHINTGETKRLSRDSLFIRDEESLKEAQRIRSERAKQAYANRKKDSSRERRTIAADSKPERQYKPSRATPQDALLRVEYGLDHGQLPEAGDVKIIVEPLKLPKRRELLRRILAEHFDQRGKCIPSKTDSQTSDTRYVTSAPIQDVGQYVLQLVEGNQMKK